MRRMLTILSFCVALLLISYAGYRGYRAWKNNHLMRLGHAFLAKSDSRNAVLAMQQLLRSDPNNLEATRMMAEITDASRSPSALLWRSRVVELDPHSFPDRIALAQTALAMRDYASATNALERVDPADKKTATYHNLAGEVAAAANQLAEAENHFLEASRIEPQNPSPQLNLAVVRLHGTNTSDTVEARSVLQRLAANPTNSVLRCQALRELTMDAAFHKRVDAALALSKQLMQETNSLFTDRILRLEMLLEARDAEFKPALANSQREAAADPSKIYELATWQMANSSPGETLNWLRSLPLKTQTNQPTTLMITECYLGAKDWHGLNSWLDKQDWGELEFIRHAYMSRALRGLELNDTAKTEWEQALSSAGGQKRSLVMLLGLSTNPDNVALSGEKQSFIMLLRLAAQWKWTNEGEDLLWTIVTRYPQERWAEQALTQLLFANGQTRSMMRLFSQDLKRTPSDLKAKNNLAFTAMLLDAKEFKPFDLAREVYQQAPTNASYASTYAYSLYLQGKKAEALKVMQQIPPKDLESPYRAGYYGLILNATGKPTEARVYLDRTSKVLLLPEERKLFDEARTGI
jgi:Flp pilus assembly protein TadD